MSRQYEKDAMRDAKGERSRQFWESVKGEADARNWSSLQERRSPAAPCIFRRVTFAFGIFLKEKSIHSCLFLKVLRDERDKSQSKMIIHILFNVKWLRLFAIA